MITRLSHTSLYVLDQNKAYDFYVNKLGFKVHTDATMDNGYRWLTVTTPEQPEFEIVLMPILHKSREKSSDFPDGFDKESQDPFQAFIREKLNGCRCSAYQ